MATHQDILLKLQLDTQKLQQVQTLKFSTVRKYIARLKELKQEAFESMTEPAIPNASNLFPESAFEFLDQGGAANRSKDNVQMSTCDENRVLSSMIFD